MTLEHSAVRDALIKSTLGLMEKGGLEGVKARSVADMAGVSVGTVYNLFGSFDRLIVAANLKIYEELGEIGKRRMAEIEANLQRRIAAGKLEDTPRNRMAERLIGLADTYVDFVAANANRWGALLAFNRTRNRGADDDSLQQLTALIDVVGDVLKGAPKWKSSTERRIAARALWSSVHGIVTTNFFGGEEATARSRTSLLLDVLLQTFTDGVFVSAKGQ